MEASGLCKHYPANTENNFIPRARGYLKLFTLIENHGEGPGLTQLRGGPLCSATEGPEVFTSQPVTLGCAPGLMAGGCRSRGSSLCPGPASGAGKHLAEPPRRPQKGVRRVIT